MNPLDTLIWLVNFPVTHGYVMIFIAGFSFVGIAVLGFRSVRGRTSHLVTVREREGLPEAPRAADRGITAARAQRLVFRILGVIIFACFVLGLLGLTGVPVTHAYIQQNGVPTTGTMEGRWVTFATAGGEEYTLESSAITPSKYPDRYGWVEDGDPVVVRYLPSHPQAFIVDTTQLPE